ncbi:MAG TPA: DUF4190 domain-containing protein [Terriglobales bacterium]|jgi:hypothetical protein|nr:DUF4190 domain-containing protein [Terriglobales bacterium]
MFCPNCGANIADGSTVCPQCGKPINAPQVPSSAAAPAAPAAYPPGAYGQPRPDAKTDGKATASLVLGILSFFCFSVLAGIPAIILGHMSRGNIRKSMGRLKGDGMALTGLILGYLSVAFVIPVLIIAAIAIPNFIRARISANEASARSELRMVTTAEAQYQTSYPDAGYAPDLATLGAPVGDTCTGDGTAEHACLIGGPLANTSCTGSQWCTKSGYRFMIQADEQRPHQQYVITAVPAEPNRTGTKNFCSTSEGTLRSEDAGVGRMTPYTAEECAALPALE